MTTAEKQFNEGVALARRYSALEARVNEAGAGWTLGARQVARAVLLSIAARYRAAIQAGHPKADGLHRKVEQIEGWAEDHGIWIQLELTAPRGSVAQA